MRCPLCADGVRELDYKDVGRLEQYLTHRDGIARRVGTLSKNGKRKKATGLCRKHQRKLAIAVKRARFMALLPPALAPKQPKWDKKLGSLKG